MATGQTILNLMEVLDQELQLQAGESNVTHALIALNAAQDYFESLIATRPKLLGDQTNTVVTAASTELTAFPTGLLRLDRLQLLDATTSRPKWDLDPIKRVGGHSRSRRWPLNLTGASLSAGEPRGYYTNGRSIYWDPLPDAIHTVRWYGLGAQADITASGTFAYPDAVMLPFASMAVRLLREGIGDDPASIGSLASSTLGSTINMLSGFDKDGASPFQYTEYHST